MAFESRFQSDWMIRKIAFLLIAANIFPALLAGNNHVVNTELLNANHRALADVGNMRLLSESHTVDEKGVVSGSRELPQRREVTCYLIGPLASMAKAEKYAVHLESAGMAMARRWREVSVGLDYWLYLPQLPSVRATTRILQELKARDVDGFIVSEGDLKGAIALGVYTEERSADERREELVAIGYEAKLQKLDRMAREYWLTSDKPPRPGALETLLETLLETEKLAEIPQKISRRDCKEVASAMQFQ